MLQIKTNGKTTIQLMKNKILIGGTLLMMLTANSALGADNTSGEQGDLYRAEELSLDVFGSASLGKYTIKHLSGDRVRENSELGAGVGMNYFITRNVGIGGDVYSE